MKQTKLATATERNLFTPRHSQLTLNVTCCYVHILFLQFASFSIFLIIIAFFLYAVYTAYDYVILVVFGEL